MELIYNGISSATLKADIVIGTNKFSVTPGYRLNTKANEAYDGDINYTDYNSTGRMLADSRTIDTEILVRRKGSYIDGENKFVGYSELLSDVSEVVQWLKSSDYKSLVIGELSGIEWSAIAKVLVDKPEHFTDGIIIKVQFICKPFTKRYSPSNVYLGSDMMTDSLISVYGNSKFSVQVDGYINTLVKYEGTAVSSPIIRIGSVSNKATSLKNSIEISIDKSIITLDVGANRQFYCEIDTKNYVVYINDLISNTSVHISKSLPFLSGTDENRLRASGFNGELKLDYTEMYDLTYLEVE